QEVAAKDVVDLGDVALGHAVNGRNRRQHRVIGKRVENKFAIAPRRDEAGAPQMLKVLGGIGDRNPAALRKIFHRPLTLGDEFQQLKAVLMAERLGDSGELRITADITVFLMADAVLAAKGGQKTPEGFYNAERILKRVLAAKGRVMLCGTCMDLPNS